MIYHIFDLSNGKPVCIGRERFEGDLVTFLDEVKGKYKTKNLLISENRVIELSEGSRDIGIQRDDGRYDFSR